MRPWALIVAVGATLACAEGGDEAETTETYGETETGIVVPVRVGSVSHDLEFVKSEVAEENLRFGTWSVGKAQMSQGPEPDRPDYYGIFPPGNLGVASAAPDGEEAEQYDLYAAFIIDPELPDTAIRDVLAINQFKKHKYRLPESWTLDSLPGGPALRDLKIISSFEEFEFLYKNQDGFTYPRLVVVQMNTTALLRRYSP